MAQLHVSRAVAVAAGDGAIMLMLAEVVSREKKGSEPQKNARGNFTVGRHRVAVELVSADGLLNLSRASSKMLSALLVSVAGVPSDRAQKLANDVVKWRNVRGKKKRGTPVNQLLVPEDLLQVPGFDRTTLELIRDFVYAGSSGPDSGIDISQAQPAVRSALGGQAGSRSDDPSSTGGNRSRGGSQTTYRLDALVDYGDRTWLRRKWITLDSGGREALPWKISRIESPRVIPVDRLTR